MIRDLSHFIQNSNAKRQENGNWTVIDKTSGIELRLVECSGTNEFEAKEDAYYFLLNMQEERERNKDSDE